MKNNAATAAAHTLGCKANQYDTEKLLEGLAARGFGIKDFGEQADIYIINTCTVTRRGGQKSLQMVRRAKSGNPAALVAVCGCAVNVSDITEWQIQIDFIFDARQPESFYAWLNDKIKTANIAPASPRKQKRTRAYIKVQDGCDRFCAYCIVPYARGPVTSKPPADVLDEARMLIAGGTREIVLTGIQISAYGKDNINGKSLAGLIKKTAALPGLNRLRLGSIEPCAVDDNFIEAIRLPAVCNHFHVSLQSGCDATLSRMNRRYAAKDYAAAAEAIRAAKPGTALTTDIIVGFPGETGADFEESLRFAESVGFARMHVFEYSAREGTAAASFSGQIPAAVKKARGKAMRQSAGAMQQRFLSKHLGQTMDVLFESERNGFWEGHTGNYITVRAKNGTANEITSVNLTHINKGIIYGEVMA
jgi:threonylcarbamoyladenosine tRNA methylthiotransferase MtaB